jgi:hypothetical protein
VRHHRFELEMPFSAARIWALFQRYDLWKEYAPSVLEVEIVYPGDAGGNGLLRKVIYPLLRTGLSGSMSLEPLAHNRTRICFRESFHMTTPVLRHFEAPIYRFINKKNEASIRGAAAWLAAHPEFRPDLVESA